jgi:TM2 domain-containing membrane protein YozV
MDQDILHARELTKDMDKNQKIIYYEQKKKNPGLMAAASLIIPGLGQALLGSLGKGVLIFFTFWLVLPWLYGIWNAYNSANRYNELLYSAIF